MQSITSIVNKLKKDFPDIAFTKSKVFSWSHNDKTISYVDDDSQIPYLFHEIGHANLNHKDYSKDIELIDMESQAWNEAQKIAKKYDYTICDDFIQNNLDTYRDWLYERSLCPKCHINGIQISSDKYSCLNCQTNWKVNQAKNKRLKKTIIK